MGEGGSVCKLVLPFGGAARLNTRCTWPRKQRIEASQKWPSTSEQFLEINEYQSRRFQDRIEACSWEASCPFGGEVRILNPPVCVQKEHERRQGQHGQDDYPESTEGWFSSHNI